jgi:hypothetical protein
VKQFRQETCDKLEAKLADKGEKLSDLLLLYPPLCTVRSAIIEHLSLGMCLILIYSLNISHCSDLVFSYSTYLSFIMIEIYNRQHYILELQFKSSSIKSIFSNNSSEKSTS